MSTTQSKTRVQTLDKVRCGLLRLHAALGSWREVGRLYGIPAGTACSVAKGREPKTEAIRKALGLPVLRLAPACKCGEVHTTKRCPNEKPTQPPKPRRNYKRAFKSVLGVLWGGKVP